MKHPKDARFEIRIEQELLRKLKMQADREGISVAELIRRTVKQAA